MTPEEFEELENAKAQAMAAQIIVQRLLIALNAKEPVLVKEVLDGAVEAVTPIAMHVDPMVRAKGIRLLQITENFRDTLISTN